MNKLKNDNGYRIYENQGYYTVVIASTKHNQYRTYEYDTACGSKSEVEEELKNHSFEEIVKRYYNECVYLVCIEQIY